MKLQILKSKLHRVTITNTHLDYEGSCAIDSEILRAAEINEYEMIHIYNLKNGERFSTYAIKAEAGSGVVTLNGAAAFKGSRNDLVIICTYAYLDSKDVKKHKPKLVYFKEGTNVIHETKSSIKVQKNNIINL
ncbi:MAG: aspartate 1-decarboxylase [Rickettsiales bacterium]|nr:aspartate 1-decarboxylase [Rickettsiales bacterium]OUT44377.1 MAG: aspartate 1-decarboxylase [Pelagibacteraceae bacterium TMED13]